jgi:hypothetical protein
VNVQLAKMTLTIFKCRDRCPYLMDFRVEQDESSMDMEGLF